MAYVCSLLYCKISSDAVNNLNIEIKTATEKLKNRNTAALQQKNHVSKYIPVAEQVLRYQKSTPKRFRVQPRGGKSKNPSAFKVVFILIDL